MLGCMIVSATLTDAFVCADVFLVNVLGHIWIYQIEHHVVAAIARIF